MAAVFEDASVYVDKLYAVNIHRQLKFVNSNVSVEITSTSPGLLSRFRRPFNWMRHQT